MTVGEKIKEIRKRKGYTQKELAKKLNIAIGTLQQYEYERRNLTIDKLKKIAEVLDVPISEFVSGIKNNGTDFSEKTIKDKIYIIADHYGYDAQSRQCIEEMAELTQAINKLWRKNGNGKTTIKKMEECMDNLIEELADVQIMILQLTYLLGFNSLEEPIVKKLDRQIERIKNKEKRL